MRLQAPERSGQEGDSRSPALPAPASLPSARRCESKNMVYTKGKAQRAIPGCTECMAAAGDPDGDFNCFYCAHNRSPIWMKSGGKDVLTEVRRGSRQGFAFGRRPRPPPLQSRIH